MVVPFSRLNSLMLKREISRSISVWTGERVKWYAFMPVSYPSVDN